MPNTRKQYRQRGGSIASDNVNRLTAKTCTSFVYPTNVRIVMQPSPVYADTLQVGGGDVAQASWFYTEFVPFMTTLCEYSHPTDVITVMQNKWNVKYPEAKLSKRVATHMLREFVTANKDVATASSANNLSIPLSWMTNGNTQTKKKGHVRNGRRCSQLLV